MDPVTLAKWINHNLFNDASTETRRQWFPVVILLVIGIVGWIRSENRLER
jgi:hypothetical protein